jgi:hypothetical protein
MAGFRAAAQSHVGNCIGILLKYKLFSVRGMEKGRVTQND